MTESCLTCGNFRNDAATLEAALPGLTSLSSAGNASRSDDGLCLRHQRYVGANSRCDRYEAVTARR